MQTAVFGFLGVLFVKLECEPAPLLLGFVLGPMMEENLRRALLLSRGDPDDLRHAAAVGRHADRRGAAADRSSSLPNLRKKREEAFAGRLTHTTRASAACSR